VCSQRLATRVYYAEQSRPLEVFVRRNVFGHEDETRRQCERGVYESDAFKFDATIDSTSTKQAVLRLLSMLDVGNDLLKMMPAETQVLDSFPL